MAAKCYGNDIDGHYVQVFFAGKRPKFSTGKGKDGAAEAKRMAKEINEKIRLRKFSLKADVEVITLEQYAKTKVFNTQRDFAQSTYSQYLDIADRWIYPNLGAKLIGDITRDDIYSWFEGMKAHGLENSSCISNLTALRVIMKDALTNNVIAKNPTSNLGKGFARGGTNPNNKKVKALGVAGVDDLLDAALAVSDLAYDLCLTLAFAGLRVGEALVLRASDLEFDRKRISVTRTLTRGNKIGPPKHGKSRLVDMSPFLLARLQHRCETLKLKGNALVFASTAGTNITYANFLERFWGAFVGSVKTDERLTPHILRHSYASQLLELGCPIAYVSEQMGHSKISITYDLYSHFIPRHGISPVSLLDGDANPADAASKQHPRRTLETFGEMIKRTKVLPFKHLEKTA